MTESRIIEDLSNPLDTFRKDLVGLVDVMTKLRRVIKYPGPNSSALFPDLSRAEGRPEMEYAKEVAELQLAREEFEEHVSNLLAKLHEARAHAALASNALAKVIELRNPIVKKEALS